MTANPRQMWAAVVAKLVAPAEPERAGKAIGGMLPMLSGYPDEAFSMQSAQWVCTQGRVLADGTTAPMNRVPTYGEIDVALGKWWRKQREIAAVQAAPRARQALPAPPPVPRDEAAQAAVRDVVAAFQAERTWHSQAQVTPVEARPCHLSSGALAAVYEQLAAQGDRAAAVRLAMLRREPGRL